MSTRESGLGTTPESENRSHGPTQAILGAYPMLFGAPPHDEAAVYDALSGRPDVAGLELPWLGGSSNSTGSIHPHGAEWLVATLPDHWNVVMTAIPSTMAALAASPEQGLASGDPGGRAAAVAETARLADAIRALNDLAGRRMVTAVEVHSAPTAGSPDSLRKSFDELLALDVDGARLLLEHCDALVPGQAPAKGFLSLSDELAVLTDLPVGLLLNWGRSALELRDPDRVVEHVRLAGAKLEGLMFSGVTPVDGVYGKPWGDSHAPFAPFEPDSLLTAARAAAALDAAGQLDIVGAKLSWKRSTETKDRVAALEDALSIVAADR